MQQLHEVSSSYHQEQTHVLLQYYMLLHRYIAIAHYADRLATTLPEPRE